MSLIERARQIEKHFKSRSFILDSPDVRSERLKDGRVILHARKASRRVVAQETGTEIIQVILETVIVNSINPLLSVNLEGLWNRIRQENPIESVGQFKPNLDPLHLDHYESGVYEVPSGFQVMPDGFGAWADTGQPPPNDIAFSKIFPNLDFTSVDIALADGLSGYQAGPFDMSHSTPHSPYHLSVDTQVGWTFDLTVTLIRGALP